MDFTKTIIPLSLMASESIDSEPIRAREIIVKYYLSAVLSWLLASQDPAGIKSEYMKRKTASRR